MAAAHQQQQEGVGNVVGQSSGKRVALEVVHRGQRLAQRQRHGFSKREPDHHPADQARPGGGRDPVEFRRADVRFGKRLGGDGFDNLDVGARRDLRNDSAEGGVTFDLAGDDRGEYVGATIRQPHHGRGGFVAARLEPENSEGGQHGAFRLKPHPMTAQPIRIGTRGSKLALAQAETVRAAIARSLGGDDRAVLDVISTTGDRIQDRTLTEIGGKGLFTLEIETALLEGRIDAAIHSLKDMPAESPEGLSIAAIPEREDPRDAFVSIKWASLSELPPGARLGTASPEAPGSVPRHARPDLQPSSPLRGNVETRLGKLAAEERWTPPCWPWPASIAWVSPAHARAAHRPCRGAARSGAGGACRCRPGSIMAGARLGCGR